MRNNRTAPAFLLLLRMKVLALIVYQDMKERNLKLAHGSLISMNRNQDSNS